MSIWAISDLHLSFGREETRARMPSRWSNHAERIASEWRAVVRPDDLVLVPGDISSARNHREVQPDLAWLDRLPGLKILSPGNHDTWWNREAKVRPILRKSQRAIGGDAILERGAIFCGTRGASFLADEPESVEVTREVTRLKHALQAAKGLRTSSEMPLYVLWHHPPFDDFGRAGPIVPMLEQYEVTACVYGHLHAESQWSLAVQGTINGVRYHCVAADAVGFRPLRVG